MRSLDDVPRLARGPGSPKAPLATLGLVGDVHAEDERLAIAIGELSRRGVDRLACTGDVADGEGSLARSCALLDEHRVLTVAGNHERWLLADRMRDLPHAHVLAREPDEVWSFSRLLPPMLEIATAAGTALLCHGIAWDDMAVLDADTNERILRWQTAFGDLFSADRFAWMLGGHTHRFMLRRFEHLGVVNAGTLCRRNDACFVRIDFAARTVEHFAFDGATANIAGVTSHPLP